MKILILGRLQNIMDNVLAIIRNGGFEALGVLTDEAAFQHLLSGEFNAIIVGAGVGADTRKKIHSIAVENEIKVIEVERGDKINEDYYQDEILPQLVKKGLS